MKALICSLLVFSILFAGCAGRDAYPVTSYIPGDEKKNCMILKAEMAQLEAEIKAKLPNTDKTGGNILLGVGGVIIWPLWLFMDLKGADKIEVEAMQRRYNALSIFAADKACDISTLAKESEEARDTDSSEVEAMRKELAQLRQELAEKIAASSDAETKIAR